MFTDFSSPDWIDWNVDPLWMSDANFGMFSSGSTIMHQGLTTENEQRVSTILA